MKKKKPKKQPPTVTEWIVAISTVAAAVATWFMALKK